MDRRDFLNATLLASGAALLTGATPMELLAEADWTGFSGVGDYARSNGNTYEVMSAGHEIRDHSFEGKRNAITDTGELFDCLVVGGGISGLSAALLFARERPGAEILVLDNHPIFGGEAKRNEFEVDGHRLMVHQGSAACFPPLSSDYLAGFYDSIGVRWDQFQYQKQTGAAQSLEIQTAPYGVGGSTSAFFFGKGVFVRDPWGTRLEGAPISEAAKRELLGMRESDRKPFSTHRYQPKVHGDEASRHLDSITLERHLMDTYGLSQETVRTYLSPIAGGGSGMGADVLSGYCEYAADVLLPWDYKKGAQMFPGGNTGVARHILKQLISNSISGGGTMAEICRGTINFNALDQQENRVRLNATVISVQHRGDSVEVTYELGRKLYRVRAKAVIMAGGSWTTKHIVRDLPAVCRDAYAQFYRAPCLMANVAVRAKAVIMAGGSWTTKHIVRDLPAVCRDAYAQFYRAPCLMANVAVRTWRFLHRLGLTECQWFQGIGNSMTLRKVATFGTDPATMNPDMPTVLTLKILFSKPGLTLQEQTARGRAELFTTSFREYENRIRDQFTDMFGKTGFDANRDIAGIILNRWGHAYLSPQPGFFFGSDGKPGPGDVLRQNSYGRIAFANSDLGGIMDHRMSILEARRASQTLTKM